MFGHIYAGHCFRSWLFPHCLQSLLIGFVLWVLHSLRLCGVWPGDLWCVRRCPTACTVFSLSNVSCPNWVLLTSAARQISIAVWRSNSFFWRSLALTPSSIVPTTILSFIKLSIRLPYSQVFALLRKSVTNWLINSCGFWTPVLKICLSYVTFF